MDIPHNYQPIFQQLRGVRRHKSFWHAYCPAHEDKQRSLSLKIGGHGQLLVKCHAGTGCGFKSIAEALNRKPEEFFPPNDERSADKRKRSSKLNIVKEYDYRDENGTLISQTVRLDPKEFRQRRPKPGGGWDWSLGDSFVPVPYRLQELIKTPVETPVYVVEGEKAADEVAKQGLVVTCSPMGAGKWRPEFAAKYFSCRKVVVVPDDDPFTLRDDGSGNKTIRYFPGFDHARDVARSMIGIALATRIVRLYSDRQKKDPYDWFAVDKRTKAEFIELVKLAKPLISLDDVERWYAANTADAEIVDPTPPETLKSKSSAMTAADRLTAAAATMTDDEWMNYAAGVIEGLRIQRKV